ncbi:MAG: IS110 family transposase, partial [Proteobacteria bacterium]|nr:IS110 family transposase [Pseudomonadota bacterium]
FLLKQHLAHIDFLLEQINDFDEEIRKKLKPHETKFKDIQSVTGVKGISAASVITEIRVDMSKFPDEARLSS